jgi:hypothetical protein
MGVFNAGSGTFKRPRQGFGSVFDIGGVDLYSGNACRYRFTKLQV